MGTACLPCVTSHFRWYRRWARMWGLKASDSKYTSLDFHFIHSWKSLYVSYVSVCVCSNLKWSRSVFEKFINLAIGGWYGQRQERIEQNQMCKCMRVCINDRYYNMGPSACVPQKGWIHLTWTLCLTPGWLFACLLVRLCMDVFEHVWVCEYGKFLIGT